MSLLYSWCNSFSSFCFSEYTIGLQPVSLCLLANSPLPTYAYHGLPSNVSYAHPSLSSQYSDPDTFVTEGDGNSWQLFDTLHRQVALLCAHLASLLPAFCGTSAHVGFHYQVCLLNTLISVVQPDRPLGAKGAGGAAASPGIFCDPPKMILKMCQYGSYSFVRTFCVCLSADKQHPCSNSACRWGPLLFSIILLLFSFYFKFYLILLFFFLLISSGAVPLLGGEDLFSPTFFFYLSTQIMQPPIGG